MASVILEPRAWLRLDAVVRTRQKLPTWSRRDVLALAQLLFGTQCLTKPQVCELVLGLKSTRTKPPQDVYDLVDDDGVVGIGELQWVDNVPRSKPPQGANNVPTSKPTGWYPKGNRLDLVFETPREVVAWALAWLEVNPRPGVSWGDRAREWKLGTRLSGFKVPPTCGHWPWTPEAEVALARVRAEEAKARTPLPDSGDLAKRYWALEVGDRVPHASGDHELEVVHVRVNLGSAPTITFQRRESGQQQLPESA